VHRLDRALGILLLLRSGATFSAAELARRFEVSPRTIYRDIELLSGVGVPVYAELGRRGGFRLLPGYFLPPVMFSGGEATALLVGAAMLRRLRATPFGAELEMAVQKVRAAFPDEQREAITRAEQAIGFEPIPADLLHPERGEPHADRLRVLSPSQHERAVLSMFLQAIVDARAVGLSYQGPDQGAPSAQHITPHGLVWDRDRWYLLGTPAQSAAGARLWRADRVVAMRSASPLPDDHLALPIDEVLGRRWLDAAMVQWTAEAPVVLSLTAQQGERLQADWYYSHAQYAQAKDGRVTMTFGEDEPAVVFALLRWLGPGARLVAPASWRTAWQDQLRAMLTEAEE
jgi:predicted DNA-binding transcriptional regulator YafY